MIDSFYSAIPFGPPPTNSDESSLSYAASDDNYLYSILEISDEGSLSDIIDGCGSGVLEKAAASYFRDMIDAVESLHGQDIIHFDIKPASFLVHDSQVKLADFGMAVTSDVKMVVGGSVSYMPPEYLMAWRSVKTARILIIELIFTALEKCCSVTCHTVLLRTTRHHYWIALAMKNQVNLLLLPV